MLAKLDIVPRWVILLIDIILTVIALAVSEILKKDFVLVNIDMVSFYKSVVLLCLINIIVFLSLKTFSGIVRYTSAQDSFRIFFAVLLSSFLIFFTHAISVALDLKLFLSSAVIIMYALFSFIFLMSYRVFIKYLFMYVKTMKLVKSRVVIYGAGEAGIIARRVFDHDQEVNKRILAFVDDDPRKIGREIDGIKILNAGDLEHLIVEHEIDELIFASYTIPVERKSQLVDVCLENDIKVLSIPSQDVWTRKNVKTNDIHNIRIEDLLNRPTIRIDNVSIQKELKGKRILITGAAGSIGSEIVRQLMTFETGAIILCDQSETALHTLQLELEERYAHKEFYAFIGDVRDKTRMKSLFEQHRPQFVYHAAAYKHVPMMENNPAEAIKTNVLGTKIIADLAVRYYSEKFVMISTDKAVNPTNVMGASKRIAEIYVQSLNNSLSDPNHTYHNGLGFLNKSGSRPITRFITTRFGNVLGSNGSVIPHFKHQIETGGPVTVTHSEITRYFMTIPEACRLVLEAGNMGVGGEIFIFDMGKAVKIVDLAKKMIRLAGLVPDVDIKIEFIGLRPGEKLYEELLNDSEVVLPTHHEKIMIGRVRQYDFQEVQIQVAGLIDKALTNDNRRTVVEMKRMVPEFKSMNSVFEELDLLQTK